MSIVTLTQFYKGCKMYVLVLTWYVLHGYGYGPAMAMTTVSGFKTEQLCLDAGNGWLKGKNQYAQALCVKAQ